MSGVSQSWFQPAGKWVWIPVWLSEGFNVSQSWCQPAGGRVRAQDVLGLVPTCLWVDWLLTMQAVGFSGPGAEVPLLVGGGRVQDITQLLPTQQWMRLSPEASVGPWVGRVGSWGL